MIYLLKFQMKLSIMLKESIESCMISVQNHQQPLSGNKQKQNYSRNTILAAAVTILLSVSSCTPKVGVLRSPDVYGGAVGSDKGKEDKKDDKKAEDAKKADKASNSIAL